MKLLWPLSIIVFALVACAPQYDPEPDCNFVQNSYGQRLSWNRNVPIEVFLHESVPHEFRDAIIAAMHSWEDGAGRHLFSYQGIIGGVNTPRQDGVSAIYWLTEWESDKTKEQGRTSIHWVGDEIKEADIRINAKDFSFFWHNNGKPSSSSKPLVEVESLALHELGHVLGLRHNDDTPSVMATYLADGKNRSDLLKSDMDSLKCEY